MSVLSPNQMSEYRELKDHRVDVSKSHQIEFNSGSETTHHICAKAIVGHIGRMNGYQISSEVTVPNGEIDVVLWGHLERLSYAVELEHAPSKEIKQDKLSRYVQETPLDDMVLINLNECPPHMIEAAAYIADELGLEL
jgi:hypothetical protein